jgi:hypothetical protein
MEQTTIALLVGVVVCEVVTYVYAFDSRSSVLTWHETFSIPSPSMPRLNRNLRNPFVCMFLKVVL